MTKGNSAQPESTARRSLSADLVIFGLGLLVWLGSLTLVWQVPELALDPSWQLALSYFASVQLPHGDALVFTYGPLGFLLSPSYSPFLFEVRVWGEVILKALVSLFLLQALVRLPLSLGILVTLSLVFGSCFVGDAFLLLGLTVATCLALRDESQRGFWIFLLGALYGTVALLKFNLLLAAAFFLVVVIAAWTLKRQGKTAVWLAVCSLGSFLFFWVLTGNEVSGLGNYVRYSLEIAAGYQRAMYLPPSTSVLLAGIGVLACLFGMTLFSSWKQRFALTPCLIGLVFLSATFLSWKHGFIRADGHAAGFLLFGQWASLLVIGMMAPGMAKSPAGWTWLGLVQIFSWWGLLTFLPPSFAGATIGFRSVPQKIGTLASFAEYRKQNEASVNEARRKYEMPRMRKIVGHHSVDVFGDEQAVAILNQLNYRPRPVFQSHAVNSIALAQKNRAFYLGESAPDFVIIKLTSLDGVLTSMRDGEVLECLLRQYEPVEAEKDFLVWRRRGPASPLPVKDVVKEGQAEWDQPIDLAGFDAPLWIAFEFQIPWKEKLRTFLFQPTGIDLEVTLQNDEIVRYRLPLSINNHPVLFSPLLETNNDLIHLAKGHRLRQVKSFRVKPANASQQPYGTTFRYRLFRSEPLPRDVSPEQ